MIEGSVVLPWSRLCFCCLSRRGHQFEVMGVIGLEESLVSLIITIYLLCLWYTLARRKHDTDIGSRLQVQARRDTLRGGSSRDDCTDVEEFRFAITYDCRRTIQVGVIQLASRLAIEQNEFVSR